jgi:hypothetical protein
MVTIKAYRYTMHADTPLTRDTAIFRLQNADPSISSTAERKRSWSTSHIPASGNLDTGSFLGRLWDSILMRTYDNVSGSRPDGHYRVFARNARNASRHRRDPPIYFDQSRQSRHLGRYSIHLVYRLTNLSPRLGRLSIEKRKGFSENCRR